MVMPFCPYIAFGILHNTGSGKFAVLHLAAQGRSVPSTAPAIATEPEEWSGRAAMRSYSAVLGT
jgi:hypothetical protein